MKLNNTNFMNNAVTEWLPSNQCFVTIKSFETTMKAIVHNCNEFRIAESIIPICIENIVKHVHEFGIKIKASRTFNSSNKFKPGYRKICRSEKLHSFSKIIQVIEEHGKLFELLQANSLKVEGLLYTCKIKSFKKLT